MFYKNGPVGLGVVVFLAACHGPVAPHEKIPPAKISKDARGAFVILTPAAIRRLAITAKVFSPRGPVPLSALLYAANGTTSLFLQEGAGVYRRYQVSVAGQNAQAFTTKNNFPAGSPVVIIGAAELNGAEEGVGK